MTSVDERLARYLQVFPMDTRRLCVTSGMAVPARLTDWRRVRETETGPMILRHMERSERIWVGSTAERQDRISQANFVIVEFQVEDLPERSRNWRNLQRIAAAFGTTAEPLVLTGYDHGWHLVYRLRNLQRLADFVGGKGGGLVHRAVAAVIGKEESKRIRVLPRALEVVAWPFGYGQGLADPDTGQPLPNMPVDELLDAVEHQVLRRRFLTVERLQQVEDTWGR